MPANHRPEPPDRPVCLLINPRSFRAARKALWQRAADLAARHRAPVRVAHDPAGFSAAIDEFLPLQPRAIAIMGGDGTLQGLLTARYRAGDLERLPPLMKFGGGRTNLIAANLGGDGNVLELLERTLQAPPTAFPTRPIDTFVVGRDHHLPEVGLFLAAAMLDDVIRDLHHYRDGQQGRWRDGSAATLGWLVRRIGAAITRLRPFEHPALDIDTDTLGGMQGPVRLLLLSTLERLGPGIVPYAARGAGPLRVFAARTDARRFWLRLPTLLRGHFRDDMNTTTGYLSGRCRELELHGLHRFCIDGQEFESGPGRIRIHGGPGIHFAEPAR